MVRRPLKLPATTTAAGLLYILHLERERVARNFRRRSLLGWSASLLILLIFF